MCEFLKWLSWNVCNFIVKYNNSIVYVVDIMGWQQDLFLVYFGHPTSNVQKAGTILLCTIARNVATQSVTIRLGRAWMVEMWIQEKY